MSWLKKIWEGWKKIARKIGDFQARVLLGIFYFVILAPVAIIINLRKDILSLKPGASRRWREREPDNLPPMEKALRQF